MKMEIYWSQNGATRLVLGLRAAICPYPGLRKIFRENFFFQKFGLAECEDFKTECEDRFFMGNWLAGQPIVKFD
jgi:hypothetical protein